MQQIREKLPNQINQSTLADSANTEQALNSPKFSYRLSTSRKSDKEVSINNLPNNLPSHTAATCFQYTQQITNKSLQRNQSRNNLNRENNQYEGNRQGQGTQWRPSQRYQMQNLNQQRGRNNYRDINISPAHPNFS